LVYNNSIVINGNGDTAISIGADDQNVSSNRINGIGSNNLGIFLGSSVDRAFIIGNSINTSGAGIRFQTNDHANLIIDNLINSTDVEITIPNSNTDNNFTNNLLEGVILFTSHSINAVDIDVNKTPAVDSAGIINISKYLNIVNTSARPISFINFNISYTDSEISGVTDESTIRIHRYNTSTGVWDVVGSSSVDTANNVVSSGNITNFSSFGMFETLNRAPNITNIKLNATDDPLNTTDANLTLFINGSDLDGDGFKNITTWYNNNSPVMLLYVPFEVSANEFNATDYAEFDNNATSLTGSASFESNTGFDGEGSRS